MIVPLILMNLQLKPSFTPVELEVHAQLKRIGGSIAWVASDNKGNDGQWDLSVDVENKGKKLDLAILGPLERLKSLRIFGGSVERSSLKMLPRLSQLQLFVVTGFEFQNDDLRFLRGCKRLTKLDIAGRNISAAGIMHIAANRSLRRLFLYNTAVKDVDLAPLPKMINLEQVVLPKTVSATAVSTLSKALPKTRITQL